MKCLLFDLSIVKLTNNHFGDFSIYLYKIDTRITFDIHFIFANQYTTHVVNFHAIGITDYIDLSVVGNYLSRVVSTPSTDEEAKSNIYFEINALLAPAAGK